MDMEYITTHITRFAPALIWCCIIATFAAAFGWSIYYKLRLFNKRHHVIGIEHEKSSFSDAPDEENMKEDVYLY